MRGRSKGAASVTLCGIMLAALLGSAVSLHRIRVERPEAHLEDVLYIPSAKALKRMSLGYNGLLADIYWTRAVQYFGWKHKQRSHDYPLLYPLLNITTELDPHLIVAYRFGATFLGQEPPDGAGQPDKAVELIEKGIKANPDDWHLYYDLGFVYAMEMGDYKQAEDAFERGSKLPHTHPFLRILAADMAQHGGDLDTARLMWQTTYNSSDDPMLRANAKRHLEALEVDETVPRLEEVVRKFKDKTGVEPASFVQLVQAGFLHRIPVDPLGMPYKLLPDGSVQVQDPEAWSFIRRGRAPESTSGTPQKP